MSLIIGPGITLGAGVNVLPVYNVATTGLVISLDADEFSSSPSSGATWPNLVTGPDFSLPNGATYSSSNGGILTFDKTLSQSAHAPNLGYSLTSFTAETWVRFNSLGIPSGQATTTITEGYAGTPINYTIGCGMTNNPDVWQGGFFDGYGWQLAGTLTPVINTWYCMAVTFDSGSISFYVNGAVNQTVTTGSSAGSGGQEIHVGERWDGSYLQDSYVDGSIPIVRLYNRALSSAEIFSNFNANRSRFGI